MQRPSARHRAVWAIRGAAIFHPWKSTRWSRNSEILQAQESFPHGGHIRPDEYLCSSRDIAVVLVLDMESKKNICRKNYSLFGSNSRTKYALTYI